MPLEGIHHLTAVSAHIARNLAFYTQTLGLRLVKKSINQDDVSAYHLFYADGIASPGTDLTFFDWPVPPERRGTRSITRTGLRIAGEPAFAWWTQRFAELGVSMARPFNGTAG
ncbi:MAG: VOC family protein [Acetobacteraceae bacterium]